MVMSKSSKLSDMNMSLKSKHYVMSMSLLCLSMIRIPEPQMLFVLLYKFLENKLKLISVP